MVDESPELSSRAAALIADAANAKHVSVASFWEIAIRVSTGKLTLSLSLAKLIADLRGTGLIQIEPLADAHLVAVSALPFWRFEWDSQMKHIAACIERWNR